MKKFIFIVIILFGIIIIGLYFYGKQQNSKDAQIKKIVTQLKQEMDKEQTQNIPTNTKQTLSEVDITKDWKLFSSTKYGFSVKHPNLSKITDNTRFGAPIYFEDSLSTNTAIKSKFHEDQSYCSESNLKNITTVSVGKNQFIKSPSVLSGLSMYYLISKNKCYKIEFESAGDQKLIERYIYGYLSTFSLI